MKGSIRLLFTSVVFAGSIGCATTVTRELDTATQETMRAQVDCPDSVSDVDGNTYATVVVGEQCWFAENLQTTKDRKGAVLDDVVVIDLEAYGRLYRHPQVVDAEGICPVGWHVPSDAEFRVLEETLGLTADEQSATKWRGSQREALRLKKSASAFSWTPEDEALVNQTGFSLLAAGESIGLFTGADGIYAGLWTSTIVDDENAWVRYFVWNPASGNNEKIWRDSVDRGRAYSVRCLKD
jgi:uncharacterized protein (TIGR02145 family)